jgi:hypothetical protein
MLWIALLSALQLLMLALLVGGLIALGAFAAGALFKTLNRTEAGLVMTVMFRRFDRLIAISTLLTLICEGLMLALMRTFSLPLLDGLVWLRLFAIVGLVACVVATVYGINPKLEAAQQQGLATNNEADLTAFEALHQRSEQLSKTIFTLALVLLLSAPLVWWGMAQQVQLHLPKV